MNHAIELESAQDLKVLHQATMFYSEENDHILPMKFLATSNYHWKSLWVNTLAEYIEKGRQNPAYFNSKVTVRHIADYAPNDFLIKRSANSNLRNIDEPHRHFLFFEAAPRNYLNEGGTWTAWGKRIAAKEIYNTTIAQRHGPLNDPSFYGVFVDGHTERVQYIDFWENDHARKNMISPH